MEMVCSSHEECPEQILDHGSMASYRPCFEQTTGRQINNTTEQAATVGLDGDFGQEELGLEDTMKAMLGISIPGQRKLWGGAHVLTAWSWPEDNAQLSPPT